MRVSGRPFPLVIAAPSGAGKTSLAHALVQRRPDLEFSISATTRPKREQEKPGKDYYFVTDAEFDRLVEDGALLEWATVHSRRYGTPRRGVEQGLERGCIMLLDIDIQGAKQVRETFPDAVLVFVLPPSADELVRRLTSRGSEERGELLRRLAGARRELPMASEFDYVVVNDEFERAVGALDAIVTAERHRRSRMADLERGLECLDAELGRILERRA